MKRSQKKAKETEEQRRIRVNMRLPSELVEWAKEYADSRNTTFTQVVVDKLTDLQAEESV
jgi:predicted DNA binding CopG/RHH family protein